MLYSFCRVIPWRLNFTCRRFGTLCSISIGLVDKKNFEDRTRCSETSARKIQTPGNDPKERTRQLTTIFFYVLLTVHLSIFVSVINQLDAQNFCFTIGLFHASTCFEHHVPIIIRSKLYYTACGIIPPVGGRPVHRLRESCQGRARLQQHRDASCHQVFFPPPAWQGAEGNSRHYERNTSFFPSWPG